MRMAKIDGRLIMAGLLPVIKAIRISGYPNIPIRLPLARMAAFIWVESPPVAAFLINAIWPYSIAGVPHKAIARPEERRVGEECKTRGSP